jgi:ACS family hexuronate transporter-like MFS transporter
LATGGLVSDYFTSKLKVTTDRLFARKIIIGGGLIISSFAVFGATFAHTTFTAIACVAIAVGALYFTGGLYWGIVNDTVESSNSGAVGGIMHACGNSAGIFAPIITGFIVQWTHSYQSAFIISGFVGLIGGVMALFLIKEMNLNDIDKYKIAQHKAV